MSRRWDASLGRMFTSVKYSIWICYGKEALAALWLSLIRSQLIGRYLMRESDISPHSRTFHSYPETTSSRSSTSAVDPITPFAMSSRRYERDTLQDKYRNQSGQRRGERGGRMYDDDYSRPYSRDAYRRSPPPRPRYSSPPHGNQ